VRNLTLYFLADADHSLGILLVDPTITYGFPLWSGYGNFHPPPGIDTPINDTTFPTYGTAVEESTFWTLNQARSKANVAPPSPDLLPLAFFTIICAQWLLICEYVNTRLGQIEWEIELGLSNLYAQNFDHTLKALLTWRRRMPIYHVFVERAISKLSARYRSEDSTAPFNSWEDILTNLRDILHRIEILHCRADKIMAVSMAVTAREESKKATQKSHAFTRVSYLVFNFAPLSFWTGFFSMSGDFPIRTYRIYTAISLPITACMLGALLFAGRFGRWWGRMREDKGLGKRNGEAEMGQWGLRRMMNDFLRYINTPALALLFCSSFKFIHIIVNAIHSSKAHNQQGGARRALGHRIRVG
jgi:hypothetical protein